MASNATARNILVTGADFQNQGAYLMMEAAFREIRERFHAFPVLDADTGGVERRRAVGAATLNTDLSEHDIDVVFDASGFHYADAWKDFGLDRDADRLHRFATAGVPVYFLPQAWGPFHHTATSCAQALASGRIAFSRDGASTDYLRQLAEQRGITVPVLSAPDFTCLVDGSPDAPRDLYATVPIIPNWNILRRAPSLRARVAYINNLALLAVAARAAGRTVVGLAHDERTDRRVLWAVRARMRGLDIVDKLDGRQAKALLERVPYAVSGRYHAAISCLSQEVPVAVHGWSHKYRHLMDDFGQGRMLMNPYEELTRSAADRWVAALETARATGDAGLAAGASRYREGALAMWRRIESDLASTPAGSAV